MCIQTTVKGVLKKFQILTQALKIHKVYPMIPLLVNSKSEQGVPLSIDGAAYTVDASITENGV
jgi:hypothetical protein